RRMSVVLLSIDGRREVTDAHRGIGVYDRVIKALNRLKSMGVNRLIARMAVTRLTDIYIDVTHLLNVGFNFVHWQLDVIWDGKWDVLTWAKSSYLPGVRRLVELFLSNLREGRVIGIVPILGVLSAYLHKPYRGPPCGAGYSSIAISTDGRVLSCPIAVHEDWAVLGNINTGFNLIDIESQLPEMCKTCEYRQYCGGRCLYAIKEGERYWGLDGVLTVDYVTKETIRTILEIGPEVKELVNMGIVKLSDLYYDPILDSAEVIP
ncbi:TIGR04084 family radical SAM/SPASM domain-containing protein, partial [Caldivirga sp.]|uniref:TIGR04084 family radical SAM/SPASM domain-containing protein n=1 Tax=Caldivirga sp. TaxID=2080243 RepID=UPI003D1275E5